MNKIINGVKYNTNTASLVGDWSNGYPTNDFNYICEELYKKNNGEYFLHAEGGALTAYGKSYGNNITYGEHIKPFTEIQAKEWAEHHLEVEEYEKEFGEVGE